ncbi:MAG: SDR family oxidoreductase [Caldilineaceae bacterium]
MLAHHQIVAEHFVAACQADSRTVAAFLSGFYASGKANTHSDLDLLLITTDAAYEALALAKRGITVNAISPSWTEDSVLNSLPEAVQNLQRNWHGAGWSPMGRLGTPADIGNAVALLCSEDASWITGQIIYADDGASLMNPEVAPELQLGQ